MTYLYVYRMTDDTGFAPCVQNGLLSLSCCKGGQIRKNKIVHTGLRFRIGAQRDGSDYSKDAVYVLGTYDNKLLYLARITYVVTMEEYFSGMSKGRIDDIYELKNGSLVRNNWLRDKKVHTDPNRVRRDLAGQYVLLSNDYVYLGKDAIYDEMVAEYNAKFQETKLYSDSLADQIVKECMKYRTNKKHSPTTPYKTSGGCR